MIETEEQRRWWFATHPEYSWSRRGIRNELKSVKRNFSAEAQYKEELAKLEEAFKADNKGLEADPHTLLDLWPYRGVITAPVGTLKYAIRRLAQDRLLSAIKKQRSRWKVGDDHLAPTAKGIEPSWTTQARRAWKNEAAKEGAVEKWGAENVERMKRGLAPQRANPDTAMIESKELHHTPIPQREGGKEFVKVWPEEHARLDPYRRLKK